ncbi:DeoR/GlpR family DNA-binding transcription regulator [Microbacterium sp. SORGH_AS_0888]|uniref:DeoR/GlpR family DNA-binding transcription regulator n=1 Tax=Microbacterium sp. SORGH_AS_0888 TaxID=3041791 RepID=UPI00278B89C2|nr:DeoR/GlpR family DNA-binding transcription regulator [Microbacterium sp. SORGH_AS_0888]MDQ1128354.1 DeoR family fructose operon transcriptional repressor [Microbacterium sp. SORGH_AS_0888]
MYAMERQEAIEGMLLVDGRVSVTDLARRFGVTTETVRRDLDALERQGSVIRVHGGAIAPDRQSTTEATLVERSTLRGSQKHAIARRALSAIGSGFRGSVFLDAGTTTGAVAALLPARLAEQGGQADVVTHAFSFAGPLADADRVALTVIGGRVRSVTSAAVGAQTVEAIGALRPDIAFVGTNGMSAEFGLSTPDPEEAAVKRAIVRCARRTVVVVDGSKFDRELLVGFAPLTDIDVLVTDTPPAGELASALGDAGVEVWLA